MPEISASVLRTAIQGTLYLSLYLSHSIRLRLQQGAVEMRRSSGGGDDDDDDDDDDGGGGGDLKAG